MRRLLLTATLLVGAAYADQVTLKNGDRLTGSVVKSDAKALTLKSEFAGTVAIDWNAVETITVFGTHGFTAPGGAMNAVLGAALTAIWLAGLVVWAFQRLATPNVQAQTV